MAWSILSRDVIALIFSHLELKHIPCVASLCKQTHAVVQDFDIIMKRICKRTWPYVTLKRNKPYMPRKASYAWLARCLHVRHTPSHETPASDDMGTRGCASPTTVVAHIAVEGEATEAAGHASPAAHTAMEPHHGCGGREGTKRSRVSTPRDPIPVHGHEDEDPAARKGVVTGEPELVSTKRVRRSCEANHTQQGHIVFRPGTHPLLWHYYGDLVGDEPEGKGVGVFLAASALLKYVGQWRCGRQHGHGQLLWKSGDLYIGDWVSGQMQGSGLMSWRSGCSYSGQFVAGMPHGHGTFAWANGNRYTGHWQRNQRHGLGTFRWAHGEEWTGTWALDHMCGRGSITFRNGVTHTGDYNHGKRHGPGVLLWPDGARFEGVWLAGARHGPGTYVDTNGNASSQTWAGEASVQYSRHIPARHPVVVVAAECGGPAVPAPTTEVPTNAGTSSVKV